MSNCKMPHSNHDKHLCYLTNVGFQLSNPKKYKALVKPAKVMCKLCGRAAANAKSVCKPVNL